MAEEKLHYIYYACGSFSGNTTEKMNRVNCKKCAKFVSQMIAASRVWAFYKREKEERKKK